MFIFHWKRCVVGRELVGMKTCGSTLSNACSRSFIAYFAKSAAVAYGEVDCSSPKAFGAPATARVKQTTRRLFNLFMRRSRHFLSDSAPSGKPIFPKTCYACGAATLDISQHDVVSRIS